MIMDEDVLAIVSVQLSSYKMNSELSIDLFTKNLKGTPEFLSLNQKVHENILQKYVTMHSINE